MGGYNSTRWGWHDKAATVEASLRLPIKDVLAGGPGSRSMYWTRRDKPAGNIRYCVTADMTRVRLMYRCTPRDREPVDYDYMVEVVTVRTAAGITQRLWRCPLTLNGRRCGQLVRYIASPPGSDYFGCRHCHRLVYTNSQEHNKSHDYYAALFRGDLWAVRRLQPDYERRTEKLNQRLARLTKRK
jgi:hypothetical protein